MQELWKKEKEGLEEKIRSASKLDNKNSTQDQLRDSQEKALRYQLELENYKVAYQELEEECEELRATVKQLRAECESYKLQAHSVRTTEVVSTSTALTQQLVEARALLSQKDIEAQEIKCELLKLQKETAKLKEVSPTDNSVLNLEVDTLKIKNSQLQAALSVERTQKKNLSRDKDLLLKENTDLKRQVKEVEAIIKRRNQSDSMLGALIGEGRLKEVEKELQVRQAALNSMQIQLEEMQVKYNDHMIELEERLKCSQEENNYLKQQVTELKAKTEENNLVGNQKNKKGCAGTRPSSASAIAPTGNHGTSTGGNSTGAHKEDAHLLATIRGMKLEITKKDKDIIKLNKDLEDARKTNRRLQREREKQLKTAPLVKHAALQSKISKTTDEKTNVAESREVSYGKPYNKTLYEEEYEETTALLKMENKTLREELQRLGQDIVTLHSKRIQDLRKLQSEHEQEIQRLLNDYSDRHSHSSVAELQGQIYTQQMVITHLKEQLKQLTELKEGNAVLKLERDHLEKALMTTKKRVQELQTPEAQQYENLLAKFENLEQRHEIREQKLQAIVRDLLAANTESVPCGTVCRNKLLDKNREICYYRVEMDRILEALRELKRSK